MGEIAGVILSGRKFAGKDYVKDHIARVVLDRPVVHFKWATPLREDVVRMMAAVGVGISVETLENRATKELFVPLLQWYGTDFWRKQDPDYWVKRGMNWWVEHREVMRDTGQSPLYVNTDTRFPNEVTIPQANGFIAIRLTVSKGKQYERADNTDQKLNELIRNHTSETALDEMEARTLDVKRGWFVNSQHLPVFDHIINSDQPLEKVYAEVDEVLKVHGVNLRSLQ